MRLLAGKFYCLAFQLEATMEEELEQEVYPLTDGVQDVAETMIGVETCSESDQQYYKLRTEGEPMPKNGEEHRDICKSSKTSDTSIVSAHEFILQNGMRGPLGRNRREPEHGAHAHKEIKRVLTTTVFVGEAHRLMGTQRENHP